MKFTVFGEPKAKGRPRFARRGSLVMSYTDKDTLNYENLVRVAYLSSCEENVRETLLEGEVGIEITAYFSIPKSVSKKKRKMMIDGEINHTKRPDIDNLCKSILDGLNKVAFHDDSQIVHMVAIKKYGEIPRVEVDVYEYLG